MTISSSLTGRRTVLVGSLALLLSGCSLFSGSGNAPMPSGSVRAEDMTATFLPMVNALRQRHGLPPLSASRVCAATAIDQAKRMALADKMNHVTSRSENPLQRFKRMGVPLPASENIAMHQATPERAFQAWVNSPKHLENMLGDYRHVGVARADSPNSGNQNFWSMCLSQ
ncbi:CAP domain-containing protein [Martelella sp. HB161492]|uniref:CAP domain-containing protein n=1 Tax=Martelella sp. HB161492 TaxID=2720726 RepID=UPI001590120F|nr:CAP domain-containing protein [Martelella sp. HB161492]